MKRFGKGLAIALVPVLLVGCGQDVTLPSTGTIYGDLLYDDGTAASGIVVLVEGTGQSAVSDAMGRFVINGILAVDETGMGRYYTVRGFGERAGTSVGFLVDHFKVKGQQSYGTGVVTVRETGSIRGRVTLEGKIDHSGIFVSVGGTSIETITQADGSYLLDRVPAHEGYELPCSHEGFESMTIDTFVDQGEEKPIRVSPGSVTDLGDSQLHATP